MKIILKDINGEMICEINMPAGTTQAQIDHLKSGYENAVTALVIEN